ncbi:hypothetical protein ACA910_021396 [Epithemia clementina (nom. ined.)]
MHNMMVEERLESGGLPDGSGGYFDYVPQEPLNNTNSAGAEDDGKEVDEAEDHIRTMEAETELGPQLQFAQDRLLFLSHAQQVVER